MSDPPYLSSPILTRDASLPQAQLLCVSPLSTRRLRRFTSPMGAAAVASFLARGRRATGRRSACPAPHRLLCPTPLLPLPDETERARAVHSPLPLSRTAPRLLPLFRPILAESQETPPPPPFPPESSSPAKSPAIVHLRPIHRTRSILSMSQGDPELFPVNPTLHRASPTSSSSAPTTPPQSPSSRTSTSISHHPVSLLTFP